MMTSSGGFLAFTSKNTRPKQGIEGQALGARHRGLTPPGAHRRKFFCLQKNFRRLGA